MRGAPILIGDFRGVDVETGHADLRGHQLVQGGLEQVVEGGALLLVVGELAVDGGEGGGDGVLFGEVAWEAKREAANQIGIQVLLLTAMSKAAQLFIVMGEYVVQEISLHDALPIYLAASDALTIHRHQQSALGIDLGCRISQAFWRDFFLGVVDDAVVNFTGLDPGDRAVKPIRRIGAGWRSARAYRGDIADGDGLPAFRHRTDCGVLERFAAQTVGEELLHG